MSVVFLFFFGGGGSSSKPQTFYSKTQFPIIKSFKSLDISYTTPKGLQTVKKKRRKEIISVCYDYLLSLALDTDLRLYIIVDFDMWLAI